MPGSSLSPSDDILAQSPEDHIQLAIEAITAAGYKPDGNLRLSICKAAGVYKFSCSTLSNHMNGIQTHAEAHVKQTKLSAAEEEVLVEWAKVLGHQGVPLTYSTLTTYASEISGKHISVPVSISKTLRIQMPKWEKTLPRTLTIAAM